MSRVLNSLRRRSHTCGQRPIRRVAQMSRTSCGVACVAMLARLTYRDAFRVGIELWGHDYWAGTHRTAVPELRTILGELGWRLGQHTKCDDWGQVPDQALVAVQWAIGPDGHALWHWVVCVHDDGGAAMVFDPRKSQPGQGRDLDGMRAAWYHRVSRI